MDRLVCAGHFEDNHLIEFIEDNGIEATCDYCKPRYQIGKVIAFDKLVDRIDEALSNFYNHPDEEGMAYDSSEGGTYGWYGAEVYDTNDLFYEVGLDIDGSKLQSEILSAFSDKVWCHIDPYWNRPHEQMTYNWEKFSRLVKHQIRYSFFMTKSFKGDEGQPLQEILNDIARNADDLGLIKKLPLENSIFRCHQHPDFEKINTFQRLTSPPIKCSTQPNRMSPAGISMFYGSFDKETARIEVINSDVLKAKPCFTVGEFRQKKSFQVLDFTELPPVPSIFDQKNIEQFYPILFFHSFTTELSKPIAWDGRQHIEYVPTQVLTEYFRYVFPEFTGVHIDGLVYESSKAPGYKCCVLFMDNEESRKYLELAEVHTTKNTFKTL